jgi:hypothetical protein
VPFVECVLTDAKAATASDVRRRERMEVANGVTVRLLARLRLTGDGGSVIGLDSTGCWISSVRSIGQRCTRWRKPCVGYGNSVVVVLFRIVCGGRLP